MGDLTKNFSRHEFECHCGCGKNAVNLVLVAALQELREKIGLPIHVNSGCRCAAQNKRVGGVRNSQHLLGRAADISITGRTPEEIARVAVQIEAFRHGGIGVYEDFIHLDVRSGTARWGKKWRE